MPVRRTTGHSSHHPRPIEAYRGKLILYGCGDCIDDYEGITGYQAYRDDLRLLYFASLDPGTGRLAALRMAPMQARQMRLHHAPAADRQWLTAVLDRISHDFGSRVDLRAGGMLALPGASLSGTAGKMRSRGDARVWDCRSRSRVPALGCL